MVWRINQLLNALALLAAVLLLGALVVQSVSSLVADRDVLGLVVLSSVVLGLFLLPPLTLLSLGAVALYRRRRVGFVYQALSGGLVGLYGVLVAGALPAARLIGIGIGTVLAAPAVVGLSTTRRQSPGTPTTTYD
jgi:hypothetical protein